MYIESKNEHVELGDIVLYKNKKCKVIQNKNHIENCCYGALDLESNKVVDTFPTLEDVDKCILKIIAKYHEIVIVKKSDCSY